MSIGSVPSSAATGGAGTFFEQHVDAYWLALLLVRGIPPILLDCILEEVHLQTRRLNWHTDDFLLVGRNGLGQSRQLAGQIKQSFTVSAKNDECNKTIRDFWRDFKNSCLFTPTSDRFALVTLRGTDALLKYFSGLLDCARSSCDEVDFGRRLSTSGLINKRSVEYCGEIQKIVGEMESRDVSVAEIWPFLRVLHVLSLDFNSSSGQAEATIKNLLAHTTCESDARGAADATWNALIRVISEGMPRGRSYQHDELPEELRHRHRPLDSTEQVLLRALSDHSAPILDGIRSTIGGLHLRRPNLVQEVIERLETVQVVLISGPAGSGKSVIAKDTVGIIKDDYFVFSFRAEEFARAHLDETLKAIQISINASKLGAIMAGQDRKVLLVESIERLLEKSTRDAFDDLLTFVVKDKGWRLLLTCRDYSTDLVQSAFLGHSSVLHSAVKVPPLDDKELGEVEATHPVLARPLANAALRRVLSNPYVLDKSLQINWSEERPLPQSEREFRQLFWRDIVRVEQRPADGMPNLREKAFVEVALRRARALTMYVDCDDLNPEVVALLRRDSLLINYQEDSSFLAPAHDVMEDWAILHWIQKQYMTHEGSIPELSILVGHHPAVRRTFRKWVTELVELDPKAADELLQAVINESGIPCHFRDDTLVSLLRSSSSAAFLERHAVDLFADDNQLFRQVIHLLRIACVTAPAWLGSLPAPASILNVPDGPAWVSILQLVKTHFSSFTQKDNLLLLGLIEDWNRGVTWQNPYPEGCEAAATIAHLLLPKFPSYRAEDQHTTILQIIVKIPKADRERFVALLQECCERERQGFGPDHLLRIIVADVHGNSVVRDMPDLAISAAKDYLLCPEPSPESPWVYERSLDLGLFFGIKKGQHFRFIPASAYRGAFFALLRHHPSKGVDFIIDVFNRSVDWYAHPRIQSDRLEAPFQILLKFANGTSRNQWCSPRLWNLYRGISSGPTVLQSILMAFERWLLEFAERLPKELDELLLSILKRSDAAALTAVIASVATAFPRQACETLLVLLQCPECVLLDRLRYTSDMCPPSSSAGMLSLLDVRNELYDSERKAADTLPHRQHDIESAVFSLQFTPFAPQVHEILDQHRAELPPLEEQDDDDRVWRLAIHRMDSRQYTVADDAATAPMSSENSDSPEEFGNYIRMDPTEPEPDLAAMIDQSAEQLQTTNSKAGLLMWGFNAFERRKDVTHDPSQWQQRLSEARNTVVTDTIGEDDDMFRGAPGFVAAACIRDRWEEMSEDEKSWCVDIVCSEVNREGNIWNENSRMQQSRWSAGRACASILPFLLGKSLPTLQQNRAYETLAVALTHPIDDVRWYAASGVGEHLWTIDRKLALCCVNALAAEAMQLQLEVDVNSRRPYPDRRHINEIFAEVASIARQRFIKGNEIPDDALHKFESAQRSGAAPSKQILAILCFAPTDPVAIAAYEQLAHTFARWWNDADQSRRMTHRSTERNYQLESVLLILLQTFLLRTPMVEAAAILEPILEGVDRNPKEVHQLVRGLISVEASEPNTPQFWSIWKLFADSVRIAPWLAKIDDEYAIGVAMVSAIFLGAKWNGEIHHWRSLEGYAEHVHALFEDLPLSSRVLDEYIRFLFDIGEQSLPHAFIRIANRIKQGSSLQMVNVGDIVFRLEVLLQRYVYRRGLELKRRRDLREAVLFLLDLLVENGSSAAFRMRDDFVTPPNT